MPFNIHTWNWQQPPEFRGFQGLCPLDNGVQWVFLGKDANFPEDQQLNDHPAAAQLLRQYLESPNVFLNANIGIHHPFRTNQWRQQLPQHDGGKYHSNFNKMLNFAFPNLDFNQRNNAITNLLKRISILELLKFPTTGNSGNDRRFRHCVAGTFQRLDNHGWTMDVQCMHLSLINKVLANKKNTVFVFSGFKGFWDRLNHAQQQNIGNHAPLLSLLGASLPFPMKLGQAHVPGIQAPVYVHTHFSSAISNHELNNMAQMLNPPAA
jgi:hypothetical protein